MPSVLWHCWLSGRVLVWLCVWVKVQICIWPSWCHCHSLSLVPVNPDCSTEFRLILPSWFYLSGAGSPGYTQHTQPLYGSLDFVQDNPGEPVPEETFTHSQSSWSSVIPVCFLHLLPSMASSLFNPHALQSFWPTVLSVEPMVQYVVCLSVVCLSSVTFCIVAKRCDLAKKCLKEWIGNQGQKVRFFGRRHISTSGFAATATKTAVFALFFARTSQQSILDGTNWLSSSKPCAYCWILWSELKPGVVLALDVGLCSMKPTSEMLH